jgi:hypothetical protein
MKISQQDQPKASGTSSSYTSRFNEDANGTHFSTVATKAQPKPAGKALLGAMAGFIAIVVGFVSSAKGEVSFFTLLMASVFGVGIGWILDRARLGDERVAAADTNFFAGHSVISTMYPEQAKVSTHEIDGFRIRNTMTGATAVTRQFIGTPGIGSAVALAGTGVRNQVEKSEANYLQHLADNSFVVEVRSNGKSIVLAGGLDESTASDLMSAVSRAVAN